jgi:hypothetical protein
LLQRLANTGGAAFVISQLLALVLLLGGTMTRPDTVLCLGPGNHYHFETVVGASCGEQAPVSSSSVPRDGCPRGSKDFRLGVDSHRGENTSVVAALAPVLAVATGVVKLFEHSPGTLPFTILGRTGTIKFHYRSTLLI